jgi:hypothetical protein
MFYLPDVWVDVPSSFSLSSLTLRGVSDNFISITFLAYDGSTYSL